MIKGIWTNSSIKDVHKDHSYNHISNNCNNSNIIRVINNEGKLNNERLTTIFKFIFRKISIENLKRKCTI